MIVLSWVWVHRAAVAVGALALVAVTAVAGWSRDRSALQQARAEAQKLAEAQGTLRGEIVAREAKARDMEAAAASLRDEIDRVKREAPGAKIVYVDRLVTGPSQAHGAPRPEPTIPAAQHPCPPCLLAEGDSGHVDVTTSGLETRAGNRVVVGRAACMRDAPAPPTEVLSGTFSAPLSVSLEEPHPLPAPARPRFSLAGGPAWSLLRGIPNGGGGSLGLRVIGGWWIETGGVATSDSSAAFAWLRKEW